MNKEKCVLCGVAIMVNVALFIGALIVALHYAS